MRAEKLMAAIEAIDDKYIAESAHARPKFYKKVLFRVAAVAACLCVAVSLLIMNFSKTSSDRCFDYSTDSAGSKVCWSSEEDGIEGYKTKSKKGEILITDILAKAISVNDDDLLFAVKITETTNQSKEVIYETFVIPLKVPENYIESQIIFVTAEQLRSLNGHENLALILSLASLTNEK